MIVVHVATMRRCISREDSGGRGDGCGFLNLGQSFWLKMVPLQEFEICFDQFMPTVQN
jgi:hypothetical protein